MLKQLGKPITGVSIDRDLKVVLQMGQTPGTWTEILKVRPPSAFPTPWSRAGTQNPSVAYVRPGPIEQRTAWLLLAEGFS